MKLKNAVRKVLLTQLAMILVSGQAYGDGSRMSDEEALDKIRKIMPGAVQMEITPDQARKILDRVERMSGVNATLMRMLSQQAAAPTDSQDAYKPSVTPSITEEELAQQIAALPGRPPEILIEDRKDGFVINGHGYVDPEGTIRSYSIDRVSGLATYLAETYPGVYLVKVTRAGANAQPIVIGTAKRNDAGWQAESRTGKRASGQNLSILNGGFLVSRDTAAFLYAPGKGLNSIAVPEDFTVTRLQRGDVLGTGYLLIERAETGNSADGMVDAIKDLGSIFRLSKAEDYQLLNFGTGETSKMNIARSGKKVGEYSNCSRVNALVNKCQNVDFHESLYNNIGRNLSHYYWRINWFSTPSGPVLIAQENGLKDITVLNLKTGQKAVAFTRELGIAGFDLEQTVEGKIRITARMGFSTETIDDAVSLLPETQHAIARTSSSAQ